MAFVTAPIRYAPVNRGYRQWLAGGLAVALHGVVIAVAMQWQWAPPIKHREPASIDVVLARQPAVEPQAAQAIAVAAQRASGPESAGRTVEEQVASRVAAPPAPPQPQAPASPEAPPAPQQAPEPDSAPEPSAPAPPPEPAPAPQPPSPEPPPKPESAPQPAAPPEPATPPKASSPPKTSSQPDAQALLAQASASVRERGFDSSAAGGGDDSASDSQKAAQRAAKARYIDAWSRRVEEYGNRYYPAPEALDGQLRIRVVIGRDGQLRQAEVIQSSQQPELDRAALDTVRGAAPYRPFDRGMGERDSLTITRVWQYGKGNNFGVR